MAILPVVQQPPEAQGDNQGGFSDPYYDDVIATSVNYSCKGVYGTWGLFWACGGGRIPFGGFDLSCKIALVSCCALCMIRSIGRSCFYFWQDEETKEDLRAEERAKAEAIEENPCRISEDYYRIFCMCCEAAHRARDLR